MPVDPKFINNFVDEARQYLRQLHEYAIALESNFSDAQRAHAVLRILHTIKGNASFLGLMQLKSITHSLESLVQSSIAADVHNLTNFMKLLHEGLTLMDTFISAAGKPEQQIQNNRDIEKLFISRVDEFLKNCAPNKDKDKVAIRANDRFRYFCADVEVSREVYLIKGFVGKMPTRALESNEAEEFLNAARKLARVFSDSGDEKNAKLIAKIAIDYETMVDDSGAADTFLISLIQDGLSQVWGGVKEEEVRRQDISQGAVKFDFEIIKPSFRIEEERIDEVLNALRHTEKVRAELGLVREALINANAPMDIILRLQKALNSLNFNLRDILQMLLKIKVTSPNLLFEKIEHLIKELAATCNKKIAIKIEGKDVFVSRGTIAILEEVLIHIVRNCIDHGIEAPEERLKLGKSEEGLISIKVFSEEETLQVEVVDDGKGVDLGALKAKALEEGRITKEEYEKMDNATATSLLFLPGLSTNADVTDISGRGIGMYAVSKVINSAGGQIEVASEPGKSTAVKLILKHQKNLQ